VADSAHVESWDTHCETFLLSDKRHFIWSSNAIILIVNGEKPILMLLGYKTKWIPVCISLVFLLIQWGSLGVFVLIGISQ